jgi:hypothetical protein
MNNTGQPEGTRNHTVKSVREAFGDDVFWDSNGEILLIAADRSLESALQRMHENRADWVVIVRTMTGSSDVYYYAYRSLELKWLSETHPERKSWPVEQGLDMHEWMSSSTSRGGRLLSDFIGQHGPAAGRVVNFDAQGRISAIGERKDMISQPEMATTGGKGPKGIEEETIDLGPLRGGQPTGSPSGQPASEMEVTLSAETGSEIGIGAKEPVDFRIELTSEASPLSVSADSRARDDLPIAVSLTAENDAVEIVGSRTYRVNPPESGKARTGFFQIKGVRVGVVRLAVTFRQGGTELGIIGLAMEVVHADTRSGREKGRAVSGPRDFADDDKLMLQVDQRSEGGQVFYDYFLHSEKLGLIHRICSKPLLDRGGGPAASTLAFVERIYERVTRELRSLDDLKQLQRESRALGAGLCMELFDPEVAKVLWPVRDRIKIVQIVSWEPYIPWELVRLRDPESGDIDDHFLAEYGLVRTLSNEMPPRELAMAKWGYLGAGFPMGTFPPIGAELDYFTGNSGASLHEHGITPAAIPATRDAFYDVLANDDFDVLHISCHAESPHQSIERASLIIGDETVPGAGKPRMVEVDTITVQAEAKLRGRRPLVFLNACETGRIGAVLTAWGGWPNVFLKAGAGAFVGSAWAVRDKPAAAFSTAFYNALLGGKTLAEAANEARASAKKLGDASWLAFKIYGHPRARRGPIPDTNIAPL